ncbi:MAG TPA: cysteine--tRNA ligase [Synergistaceae bacterium]|uniref:cysteine--tRNA ligase n=1 Tax=Synergistaceae TaxID=649777 RepID=UPI000ED043DE|nr:cysteine--tRNA ligase [Synergistaceae bacterium DZ-S4]HAH70052.1 cysteine--tRNA ligase [Synergistaceae bacterium]
MALAVYNDLTRKKEPFEPIEKGKVRFYVCGPTVYDFFHIGNARPFVLFDVFRRYLESTGYKVIFVQNFTDIDDKMIRRANEMGISVPELAEKFIGEYFEDADSLGIKRATVNPRATHEIDEIIRIVGTLIEKGHAYEKDGDVYFSVVSFPEYGKLSKQGIEELKSGARIEVDERKNDPLDFALWKASKPGEPFWESPWGKGRPGWHIECSAMSTKYLGDSIDIHGGGSDLIFPHHENEIAQSECASGCQFVKYWLHNAYIMIDKEKMSKSLGNFMTVRDIRKRFNPLVLRFFLLSAHYRSPINFSKEGLDQAQSALERINNCYADLKFAAANRRPCQKDNALSAAVEKASLGYTEAMEDDFNTAGALGCVFDVVRAVNVHLTENEGFCEEGIKAARDFLEKVNCVFGFFSEDHCDDPDEDIDALLEERAEARKYKNFRRSDEIRDMLAEKGIIIEDTPQGARWKRQI